MGHLAENALTDEEEDGSSPLSPYYSPLLQGLLAARGQFHKSLKFQSVCLEALAGLVRSCPEDSLPVVAQVRPSAPARIATWHSEPAPLSS